MLFEFTNIWSKKDSKSRFKIFNIEMVSVS